MKDLISHLLANPQITEAIVDLGLAVLALTGLMVWRYVQHLFDESEQRQMAIIAKQAVAYAEEWARARAKGAPTPSGAEKLERALEAVKTIAKGRLKRLAQAKWEVALHAELPALRAQSVPPPATTALVSVWDEPARPSIPPRDDR